MKKIRTRIAVSMLIATSAVLTFVGIVLIINMTVNYYRSFSQTVSLVFGSDRFKQLCSDFDGDINGISKYLEDSKAVLDQNSQKDYYILQNGNVIKSSRSGGILKMTDNLSSVLNGGYSHDCDITSDALDFAYDAGLGCTVYVIDTRAQLVSSIKSISLLFLQALLIGIFLAAVLSIVISKRLTASVKALENGAQRMSRGDFSPIPVCSNDETGNLCRVFNEMGRQIQSDFEAFEAEEQKRRDFVANVSHELKTPITVIKSYSETLAQMNVDPENQKRFLNTIVAESDRMSDIVGQLLYISRLESRQLNISAVDLRALCNAIAASFEKECERKQLHVSVTGNGCVQSDAEHIRTIVTNLFTNAIKYSDPGGKIEAEVSCDRISVTDHGIGISKKDAPHVFERFYRADKARGRQTGGTGLGLAIAMESARLIGAKLTLDSVVSEYTKFTLEF